MELLEKLCAIPGTSGDEGRVRDFLLEYCIDEMDSWKNKPEIWHGAGFQDNLVLVFGKPKVAFYAHLDTVGFTIRYDNYVVPIGGVDGATGDLLVFEQDGKTQETHLIFEEDSELTMVDAVQKLEPGTTLTYAPKFIQENDFVKSPYLDDRLGVWALLQLAPWAENIALVFTTYEEHGGGGAGYIARILFEKYRLSRSIIADVTWSTVGVFPGKGPVISLRDSRIPRKQYVDEIRRIAKESGIPYQLEVEFQGGSDGREIQHLPYPIDWCFIGPPSENPHAALESVHSADIGSFVEFLATLAREL
jgi:putative aminopeptidase FrvX